MHVEMRTEPLQKLGWSNGPSNLEVIQNFLKVSSCFMFTCVSVPK